MTERTPQSTAKLVVFKAYLASDHVTEATGKTIAITISKNGGAFGNPAAGATNATEISSGWYKVSLGTGDTDTLGPLAIRGAVATIDDVGILTEVVSATSGGYTNLDAAISTRLATAGYTAPLDAAATRTAVGLATANLDTQLDALPTNGELTTALGTADDAVLAQVALVKAKTDLIPASPAAVGSAMTLTAAYDAAKTAATQTSVDDLPTNAELTTALGTADDATLAQIALVKAKTDNLPSDPADASDVAGAFSAVNSTLSTIAGFIDTEVGAIKTKTDSLTFTVSGKIDANITHVNATAVTGDGQTGTEWGPA